MISVQTRHIFIDKVEVFVGMCVHVFARNRYIFALQVDRLRLKLIFWCPSGNYDNSWPLGDPFLYSNHKPIIVSVVKRGSANPATT